MGLADDLLIGRVDPHRNPAVLSLERALLDVGVVFVGRQHLVPDLNFLVRRLFDFFLDLGADLVLRLAEAADHVAQRDLLAPRDRIGLIVVADGPDAIFRVPGCNAQRRS